MTRPTRTAVLILVAFAAAPFARSASGQQAPGDWQRTFAVGAADLATIGENPYFILKPGSQLTLEGKESGKTVRLVVTVLDETRAVGGIDARVVEERESENGVLVEVSRNFMAIRKTTRDIYYLGEEVDIYKDGEIVDRARARGCTPPRGPRSDSCCRRHRPWGRRSTRRLPLAWPWTARG